LELIYTLNLIEENDLVDILKNIKVRRGLDGDKVFHIRNNMFYIWHTLLIALFISIGFVLGYKLGNKKTKIEEPKGKCPFGFDQEN
jgi:hypothetical protein